MHLTTTKLPPRTPPPQATLLQWRVVKAITEKEVLGVDEETLRVLKREKK
jgi:hypothetical protein